MRNCSHIETPNTAVSSADKVAGSNGVRGQQRVKGFCRIGSLSLSRDFHVMRSRTAVVDAHRYSVIHHASHSLSHTRSKKTSIFGNSDLESDSKPNECRSHPCA